MKLPKATREHYLGVCDKLGNALMLLELLDHECDRELLDAAKKLQRQCLAILDYKFINQEI